MIRKLGKSESDYLECILIEMKLGISIRAFNHNRSGNCHIIFTCSVIKETFKKVERSEHTI